MAIDFEAEAGKAATTSVTILGAAFAILTVVVFQILGVEIPVSDSQSVINHVHDVIISGGVIAGCLASIYGRIKASTKIASWF